MTPRYGATSEEWQHFSDVLNLRSDLLPVVSNPCAEISAGSKIKALGKVPSTYNGQRTVVGLPAWTTRCSTESDIERWAAEPDYGVCVQTRVLRALDIDVDDPQKAKAIEERACALLGVPLPCRTRSNSGKRLLVFLLPGEMAKRRMTVDGGVTEFLATGQQFVAVGTHPSGARYEWVGGLPQTIPEVTAERFETAWGGLTEAYATEPVEAARAVVPRQRGARVDRLDPVVEYLHKEGLVVAEDSGSLHVVCPWEDEHSEGVGDTSSTVWFPAGTHGYERGNFRCLHAHCAGRERGHFLNAIGYKEDVSGDFEVLPAPDAAPELPVFERDKRGKIEATLLNVLGALGSPHFCGAHIAFDQFTGDLMLATPSEPEAWRRYTDNDHTRLRETLNRRGFKEIGRELMRDAVRAVGERNAFDSAQKWVRTLAWDGVPRIEQFFQQYWGVEDSPYARSCSRYFWTGMVGRVLDPGCKADMVTVLIGPQGCGKSSGLRAVVPQAAWFAEIDLALRDADLCRAMRGSALVELPELRGLAGRDAESIKAWITRQVDKWTAKYQEMETHYPRRGFLAGTSNHEEFLVDETGNRRWLPLWVTKVDVAAIVRDREQLWAEAASVWEFVSGVDWQDAERLARDVHAAHMVGDSWADTVVAWLEETDFAGVKPLDKGYLRVGEVLQGALNIKTGAIKRSDEVRLGRVLRGLGFEKVTMRAEDDKFKAWVRAK